MPLLQGIAAIVLWSTLASLTALAGPIPPFQLAAMTFAVGAMAGALGVVATGQQTREILSAPPGAIALGVAGLLGYHALYFYALQSAPAIEANVINYLWPLLIVLFSALLPARHGGQRLTGWHLVGALVAFAGALIAIGGPAALGGLDRIGAGHLAALAAAGVWAAYSVASRLYRHVPSASVVASSALTALGALGLHLAVETTAWPATPQQWAVILAMGLGPVGLAFKLWDSAVKHGDIRLVGVVSYATPLFSTALLAALGLGHAGPLLWLAVVLVTLGAVLAARDRFQRVARNQRP
jgi:drug/metabolite transporter (DMT)-like permease